MAARHDQQMLEAGVRAPDFQLKSLDSALHNLKSVAGDKGTLLAFFKVSCPTCQLTLPFLDRMHRQGARVFAISQDDAFPTQEFHRHFGITMPTLLDPEDSGYPASNAYQISHVPSMFLVEPHGEIAWSTSGFSKRDLEDLASRLGVRVFEPGEKVPDWKGG